MPKRVADRPRWEHGAETQACPITRRGTGTARSRLLRSLHSLSYSVIPHRTARREPNESPCLNADGGGECRATHGQESSEGKGGEYAEGNRWGRGEQVGEYECGEDGGLREGEVCVEWW